MHVHFTPYACLMRPVDIITIIKDNRFKAMGGKKKNHQVQGSDVHQNEICWSVYLYS